MGHPLTWQYQCDITLLAFRKERSKMTGEKEIRPIPGSLMVLILLVVMAVGVAGLIQAASDGSGWRVVGWVAVISVDGFCFAGLTVVSPNESKVLTLFGVYRGS